MFLWEKKVSLQTEIVLYNKQFVISDDSISVFHFFYSCPQIFSIVINTECCQGKPCTTEIVKNRSGKIEVVIRICI